MGTLFNQLDQKAISLWSWFTSCVFQRMDQDFTRSQHWFQRLWLSMIYILSLALWTFFLNFGNFVWGIHDWILEWRYSRILKEAITSAQIPFHTDPPIQFGISRFFGIPDVNLAPQMLLLRFLDPGLNFLINMLLMVSIGYIGCLAIRRYFRLSIFSFSFLTLLMNFNGFITAHIGIGHTAFTGYFILPFFVLLLFQLIERRGSTIWFAQMGLVLFGIGLLGSSRILAACFLFLGVLFLFAKSVRIQILKAMIAGVMLNLYRIVPASITLPAMDVPPYAGFSTVGDLIKSLTWIIDPSNSLVGLPIGWWEFDMYVGVLGLLFIAYFGFYRLWRSQETKLTINNYLPLGYSLLVFTAFSIGYIYMPINLIPIPIFNHIHVPSRFFILPLLFLIAIACHRLQEWLNNKSFESWQYGIMVILFAIFGADILQHTRLWRVEMVSEAFSGGSFEVPLNFSLHISNQIDPLYTQSLIISGVLTLISIVYTVSILIRGGKKQKRREISS